MSLPFIVSSQVVVGISFALACPLAAQSHLERNTPLGALLLYECMLVTPCTVYFMGRFPAWSWLYWVDPVQPMWASSVWLLLPTWVALGSFLAARLLLMKGHRLGVAVAAGAATGLSLTLLWATLPRWSWVGTYLAYRQRSLELRPFTASAAGLTAALALPATSLGWGFSLWRLHLMERADRLGTLPEPTDGSPPQVSAELLQAAAKPAGTRKT